MKRVLFYPHAVLLLLLLLLLLTAIGLTACATSEESDNASVRPWNTPKGWETGLPSNMSEGR